MNPILQTLQLQLISAGRAELDLWWQTEHTSDPFDRLFYIESGNGWIRHQGRRYELVAGGLYVMPALHALAYGCSGPIVIHWAHFTSSVLGGMNLFHYPNCAHEVPSPDPAHFDQLFTRLWQTLGRGVPGEEFETLGLLLQLLAPFLATIDAQYQSRRHHELFRLRRVLEHIDQHLGEPIRIEDLARLAHLEATYFTRIFAAALGSPPARFILRKRIERAQRRLLESDATLAALAAELGFSDAFHFSKTFKKITGVTPRDFRRQIRTSGP